jgi:hypothetical protein
VWELLAGQIRSENVDANVLREVREVETWIVRFLCAPVPVPGKTRLEASQIFPSDFDYLENLMPHQFLVISCKCEIFIQFLKKEIFKKHFEFFLEKVRILLIFIRKKVQIKKENP